MRGINKVILVGTLGVNPEIKPLSNGGSMASLSVATSEEWLDKMSGKKQQKTEWHRVSIFGKLAEIAGKYLSKGSQVYLEGKLQTRKWQDQNGQDRYSTDIVLSGFDGVMQMLGGPREQKEPTGTNNGQSSSMQSSQVVSQINRQQANQIVQPMGSGRINNDSWASSFDDLDDCPF